MGAAGFILLRPYVIPATAANPTKIKTPARIRFFNLDFAGRLMSIKLRLYSSPRLHRFKGCANRV